MGGPARIEGVKATHPETDNFQPIEFVVDGVKYFSPENYFQCQKSVGVSQEEFERTRKSGTGADVWMAGMRVSLRKDWEMVKVRVMYTGNRAKFEQHPALAQSLVSTGNAKISFHASSDFWCNWNAIIMTLLREEFKAEGEQDKELIDRLWRKIEAYEADEEKKLAADDRPKQPFKRPGLPVLGGNQNNNL